MSSTYRPWGPTDWVMSKLGERQFSVLACLATEKRSGLSIDYLSSFSRNFRIIKIKDPFPISEEHEESAFAESKSQITNLPNIESMISEDYLKASLDRMHEYIDMISADGNVIFDITSFPKRWFFPMVLMMQKSRRIKNLIINYTQGSGYAETLSENPEGLRPLPGFTSLLGRKEHDFAFVGVGFHAANMNAMFEADQPKNLRLLFPFPPGPPGLNENWKFVENIDRNFARRIDPDSNIDPVSIMHLPALDVSSAFDVLCNITDSAKRTSMLAPYGPKPISLAMCLFASAAQVKGREDVPVFYSQPQRYSSNYTSGASITDGKIQSWSYLIKSDGKNIYGIK